MSAFTTARLVCDFCGEWSEIIGANRLAIMGSDGWKSFWSGDDICPACWDAGARFRAQDYSPHPVRCLVEEIKRTRRRSRLTIPA